MKKFLVKALILTLIIGVLMVLATPVLKPNWNYGNSCFGKTTRAYLDQPDDSIDVLFLGSSQILRDLDTVAFRDEYGIAAYTRATAVQFPAVTYYYLKEATEHHDLKVVVSDFSNLYISYDPDKYEPYLRYAFDYMPLSADKLTAVKATIQGSETQSTFSYIFPFLRYHSRWRELTWEDVTWPLHKQEDDAYGSILCEDVKPLTHHITTYADTPKPYDEDAAYWYGKIIELCKEKQIKLILLRLPRENWSPEMATGDLEYAEKYNVTFYDLNSEELYTKIGFNDQTDFMDTAHLNAAGAKRITPWLANILNEAMTK